MSRRFFKGGSFCIVLLPFLYIVYQAMLSISGLENALGADPGQAIVQLTGKWALHAILLILLVSPLMKIAVFKRLASVRRMFGLYAFFYVSLHLLCFWLFILAMDASLLLLELWDRPYISVGFVAWIILLALAITSNRFSQKLLRQNWRRLHKGVYWVAALAMVHFYWLSRSDIGEVLLYAMLVLLLLLLRWPLLVKIMSKLFLQLRQVSGN